MLDDLLRSGEERLTESGMGFTGPSSKPGSSPRLTREYFDSLLLETRVIDAIEASTRTVFFGVEFAAPVMVAALSSLDRIRPGGMAEAARGAASAGMMMWAGVGDDAELLAAVASGARVVKIVKPYRDHELVLRKIDQAERCGAFAVGMDVSFSFGMKTGYMPAPMSPKTLDDLKRFVKATRLPFVLKGILSEQDAKKAVDAGAAAVVVSHQGGTVLDYAVPPLLALPRVVKAVGGALTVFVDCGVASGLDAFKALALGADGVCVGRAVAAGLAAAGAEGVEKVLNDIAAELKRTMSLVGAKDVEAIDPSVIWPRNF